jgi:hypothetical protein
MNNRETYPKGVHSSCRNHSNIAGVHEVEGTFQSRAQFDSGWIRMSPLHDGRITNVPDPFQKSRERISCPIVQSRECLDRSKDQ